MLPASLVLWVQMAVSALAAVAAVWATFRWLAAPVLREIVREEIGKSRKEDLESAERTRQAVESYGPTLWSHAQQIADLRARVTATETRFGGVEALRVVLERLEQGLGRSVDAQHEAAEAMSGLVREVGEIRGWQQAIQRHLSPVPLPLVHPRSE